MFDAMAQLHGEEAFSGATWDRIAACMVRHSQADLNLLETSDAAWEGFVEYGRSGGALDGSDPWGGRANWIEYDPVPLSTDNATIPGATDVVIQEPCNFASNLPYYRYVRWAQWRCTICALSIWCIYIHTHVCVLIVCVCVCVVIVHIVNV
jgi:hypothetical protein